MSLDVRILVIEWTAYDVVSLQHITLAWKGWSGGAMVLRKLPVPGRLAYLDE